MNSKTGSTYSQTQLNLYQFYCVLHVSALVKSHHQAIKNTMCKSKMYFQLPDGGFSTKAETCSK